MRRLALALLLLAACKPQMQRLPRRDAAPAQGTAKPRAAARRPQRATAASRAPRAQLRAAAWNFDRIDDGALPTAMRGVSGSWRVVFDKRPNKVLLQRSPGKRADRHVLMVRMGRFATVSLSVRLAARSGRHARGGGLLWRATRAGDYYAALLDPQRRLVTVLRFAGGKVKRLARARLPRDKRALRWRRLHVAMNGARIVCSVDGRKVLETRDGSLPARGGVGLITVGDAVTAFDDLALRSID